MNNKEKIIKYIDEQGMDKILEHSYDFVNQKLVILKDNDGKQTPMKGHPVFIAMHACACCCRGCLEKWHDIPKNKKLSNNEINYIVTILMEWIKKEYYESINNQTKIFFSFNIFLVLSSILIQSVIVTLATIDPIGYSKLYFSYFFIAFLSILLPA